MKSILTVTLLMAVLSLCNFADKSKPTNASAPANANTSQNHPDSGPANGDTTQNQDIDRDALTAELIKIEYEVTTASFKGDISTLARYVADDYYGTNADGTSQNKNQLLSSLKPDRVTKEWKITDGQLVSASEDTAVLNYIQTEIFRNGRSVRARITDTFVKRNGRWLVKSEQQTLMR